MGAPDYFGLSWMLPLEYRQHLRRGTKIMADGNILGLTYYPKKKGFEEVAKKKVEEWMKEK
jgi:hypothetical protein